MQIDILKQRDLDELIRVFNFPWTTEEATRAKWDKYLSEQNV